MEATEGGNALTVEHGRRVPALEVANRNASNLQKKLDALHSHGGGFLHFRPGRYYIGRRPVGAAVGYPEESTENGDIVVYDDVTLWFAPGAVLVPLSTSSPAPVDVRHVYQDVDNPSSRDLSWEDQLVRIEIHGSIRAQRVTIFATFASPDGARSDDDRPDAGLVLLVGDRIDEVLPEWWGANQQLAGWNNPLMNAHAIQAAFDAAHRHRLRPLRDPSTGRVARESSGGIALRQMPPIPIVMVNRYDISHEVSLGMTRPEAAGAIDPCISRCLR